MKKTRGYGIITYCDSDKTEEVDTWACVHCQRTQDRIPFKSPTDDTLGRWCQTCDGPVCMDPKCARCIPFERKLEMIEARDRLARAASGRWC